MKSLEGFDFGRGSFFYLNLATENFFCGTINFENFLKVNFALSRNFFCLYEIVFWRSNLNDRDFSERVLSVIRDNLFDIKKLLFNLDDCVSKKELEQSQNQLDDANNSIDKLQDVRAKLEKEISNKNFEVIDLLRQNSDLNGDLERQFEEIERREEKLNSARTQIEELLESLEEKKRQLAEKTARLNYYAENYLELEKAYQSYKNLPEDIKFSLRDIFGPANTATSFMVNLLQQGHLEMLFEYITDAIEIGAPDEDVENLLRIFDFAFKAINGGHDDETFTVEVQAEIGN